ncbi:hypothetical protein Moror_15976 [Moniliophthora roreri MCA 2997]|uniref:Uncharacterized protein n=1 Tax=Moniliophthora roreri (strain MCA 2997) TaxID=1381753 RepID=V2X0U1_MONRO|nr:hypothetical protein Moror_15976 [Moniliophthora roreri MCA 2997]
MSTTQPRAKEPEGPFALYPLTVFDRLFERSCFVTGWLVEGRLDESKLGEALGKITDKWRLLAGRVRSSKDGEKTSWHLKIPLGPLPCQEEYPTYKITTSTSELPIFHYVPHLVSGPSAETTYSHDAFPHTVFLHPSTPRRYSKWESDDSPLLCWHLTRFPASNNSGKEYTCLGFARSHGVFDGGGAAQIINALMAELRGEPWTPPSPPQPGSNTNPLQEILNELDSEAKEETQEYDAHTVMTIGRAIRMIAWHMRERYWRGAGAKMLLVPGHAVEWLVDNVRRELGETREKVSTGDVLVAWMMKTIYSVNGYPSSTVHLTNLASFRSLLAPDSSLSNFPHNAWLPPPSPLVTASEFQSLPLATLTKLLSDTRMKFSKQDILRGYRTLRNHGFVLPGNWNADEDFLVSNVSASRILEADWTLLATDSSAGKTICCYRYSMTPNALLLTNMAYISGRLRDGTHVIDLCINKQRMGVLENEVRRIVTESEKARRS